jgi:peroxiredoxin
MRFRSDVVLFVALLAGSAYAVATQVGHDPIAAKAARDKDVVPIGGVVPEVTIKDWQGKEHTLAALRGKTATVLYFFSADCPCVPAVQMRLHEVLLKYREKGVEFVAIAGSPEDSPKAAFQAAADARMMFMRILMDPEQKLVRTTGVVGATDVAVLDGEGRVVYRGTIDDALTKPKKPYLEPVLAALTTGGEPPFHTSDPKSYGCSFPGYEGECPIN